MATEELNRSTSSGATESQTRCGGSEIRRGGPPSPSPSTEAPETAGGPPRRIRHLQPEPVSSRVYQALADANCGFEKLAQNLEALQQFNFFPAGDLTAWLDMVLYLQAESNSTLLESLTGREINNAAYYDRRCHEWERQLKDPDDVFIEAEHRRQELAEEQKRSEESDD